MKIYRLTFLLLLTIGSSAFADDVGRLVYSKCDNGFLTIALTTVVNYKIVESDDVVGLRWLRDFADEGKFDCQSEGKSFSVVVSGYYPARAKGMCGGIDSAKLRLVETKSDTVAREAWIPMSHGRLCSNTDRQIRMGNGIFRVCSKPAKLDRDPTLLDMTGFDCVDLVER